MNEPEARADQQRGRKQAEAAEPARPETGQDLPASADQLDRYLDELLGGSSL